MDNQTIFNSIDEECNYWKEQYKIYSRKYTDLQQELDDFTESSQQLEAELETSLEQREKTIKDLQFSLNQTQNDCESLRKRSVNLETENVNYEKQYKLIYDELEHHKIYIRELEQKNDDLERAHRVVTESVTGFESMLNQAYEKNALLEMEIDDKEALQVKLQRLMDETRDLKQELNIKSIPTTNNTTILNEQQQQQQETLNNINNALNENDEINKFHNNVNIKIFNNNNINTISTSTTSLSTIGSGTNKFNENLLNGNSMAASSRISALMIVGELLRKVNNMEARLKACHAAMPPPRHQQQQQHHANHHHHNHHNDSNRSSLTPTVTRNSSSRQ